MKLGERFKRLRVKAYRKVFPKEVKIFNPFAENLSLLPSERDEILTKLREAIQTGEIPNFRWSYEVKVLHLSPKNTGLVELLQAVRKVIQREFGNQFGTEIS